MPKVKIGVFDSGVGGLSVANAIGRELPDLEIILKEDKQHLPYGSRDIEEIHGFIRPIFQEFIDEGCKAVVVACNTVTTNLISQLRQEFPIPMVGMEPMLKPAAERTKTGTIAVFATPRTLGSQRYAWLKGEYAKGMDILEPDCSDWALMIENNSLEREKVAKTIEDVINRGADEIVLGCTHYPLLKRAIGEVVGRSVRLIDSAEETAAETGRVLEEAGLAHAETHDARYRFNASDAPEQFLRVGQRFLGASIDRVETVTLG